MPRDLISCSLSQLGQIMYVQACGRLNVGVVSGVVSVEEVADVVLDLVLDVRDVVVACASVDVWKM